MSKKLLDQRFTCPRRIEGTLQNVDFWRNGVCNCCGSCSSDMLFRAIEKGKKLRPTDKVDTVYIGKRKFLFNHLSWEEKIKFVKLLNAGEIKFDFPGNFYIMPFFIDKKQ